MVGWVGITWPGWSRSKRTLVMWARGKRQLAGLAVPASPRVGELAAASSPTLASWAPGLPASTRLPALHRLLGHFLLRNGHKRRRIGDYLPQTTITRRVLEGGGLQPFHPFSPAIGPSALTFRLVIPAEGRTGRH